jgi:hypothetical protein
MKRERIDLFWQGMIAGLLGYAMIAVTLALWNVLMGRSAFYTAALLGQTLFYGLTDPKLLSIWPGPVLAYNGLHLIVFLGLGLFAAWLAEMSERGPHLWYVASTLMLIVVFHLFGAYLFVNEQVRNALSPWAMLLAGFLAMALMTLYLVGRHPRLREEFRNFSALDPDLADTSS